MISRKSSHTLGKVYAEIFKKIRDHQPQNRSLMYIVDTTKLYKFLFDNEYPAWFCNRAASIESNINSLPLQFFIMKIHTGETLYENTKNWTLEKTRELGQEYLNKLAEDILNYWNSDCDNYSKNNSRIHIEELEKRLKLDGYIYDNSRLLFSEENVLDVQEQKGILEFLISSLHLSNADTSLHHLNLSEDNYVDGKWDDSISQSRKFFESILRETASVHSIQIKKNKITENIYNSPKEVRFYLENVGIINKKEKEALTKIYGLLSETGAHPYMAQNEQARLMRHLALTFAQFVMIRLRCCLANSDMSI